MIPVVRHLVGQKIFLSQAYLLYRLTFSAARVAIGSGQTERQ